MDFPRAKYYNTEEIPRYPDGRGTGPERRERMKSSLMIVTQKNRNAVRHSGWMRFRAASAGPVLQADSEGGFAWDR
jgi:hypothetical protein